SAAVEGLTRRCDRVLCVSAGARSGLIDLGVPADRIALLPPSVSTSSPSSAADPAAIRAQLATTIGQQLVVGCGEAGWRKGADLFVDVARRSTADATWAWVGRRPRSFGRVLDHDVEAAGLTGRIRWVGEVADARPFLAAADLVVMPSREDPQPLVPLEAAVASTATVGFAVGGLALLAADSGMAVAPYPDTVELARLVDELLAHPERRDELAGMASTIVRERHDVDVLAQRFSAELRTVRRLGAPSDHDGDTGPTAP
ncbi:MAG: glycosyltransferase family 4 protein, partial [Actinomycetes bacterium]